MFNFISNKPGVITDNAKKYYMVVKDARRTYTNDVINCLRKPRDVIKIRVAYTTIPADAFMRNVRVV